MNDRQLLALRHHCRLDQEAAHPRFGWSTPEGSIRLTVNSGYE